MVVTLVRHLARVANRVPQGSVHLVRSGHQPDSVCSAAVVIRPNSVLRPPDDEGAYALSRAYAQKFSWSWGESNPRPTVRERTRYDHSRRCT
jgi:hypothetical protein